MKPPIARHIFHVDGDAFFASCEVARNPALRGKPVVTGKERGIVSAASYEAKALGIMRGVPLSQVRKLAPDAIIVESDYEAYTMYSKRMYAIARRYTSALEEYGIDECFGDITGLEEVNGMSAEDTARALKAALKSELNMSFSVGLGPTKVLAKLGSKHRKPDGFTLVTEENREQLLRDTPLKRIWGIGPATATKLSKLGLSTALDFTQKSEAWVREQFNMPIVELWQELNGESVLDLTVAHEQQHSIQVTRTFKARREAAYLYSELSKNVESACEKARRMGLKARVAHFFLKTQEFSYRTKEVRLMAATNLPQDILAAIEPLFMSLFTPGRRYRATGVTLSGFTGSEATQLDLFDASKESAKLSKMYTSIDALRARYGRHAVFLGTSFAALAARGSGHFRAEDFLNNDAAHKRLPLPYLGEVG